MNKTAKSILINFTIIAGFFAFAFNIPAVKSFFGDLVNGSTYAYEIPLNAYCSYLSGGDLVNFQGKAYKSKSDSEERQYKYFVWRSGKLVAIYKTNKYDDLDTKNIVIEAKCTGKGNGFYEAKLLSTDGKFVEDTGSENSSVSMVVGQDEFKSISNLITKMESARGGYFLQQIENSNGSFDLSIGVKYKNLSKKNVEDLLSWLKAGKIKISSSVLDM